MAQATVEEDHECLEYVEYTDPDPREAPQDINLYDSPGGSRIDLIPEDVSVKVVAECWIDNDLWYQVIPDWITDGERWAKAADFLTD